MGIFSEFGIFDTDDVDLHSDIEGGPINKLFRGVNALREHILDTAPVGKATRTFKGHDHADSGPPISRGCIYCEDGGNREIWKLTPTVAGAYTNLNSSYNPIGDQEFSRLGTAIAAYPVSPILPGEAILLVQLHYKAIGANFQLRLTELYSNKRAEVELAETTPDKQTEMLFVMGCKPGVKNELFAQVQSDKAGGEEPPTLSIFSLSLFETVWQTTPMVEVGL